MVARGIGGDPPQFYKIPRDEAWGYPRSLFCEDTTQIEYQKSLL